MNEGTQQAGRPDLEAFESAVAHTREGLQGEEQLPPEAARPQAQETWERLKRLEESTEIEFIRRETRLIPSVVNFWRHFKWVGSREDLRSRAAMTSLLWRIFSPGTAAAGAGLLVLVLTAVQAVLIYQQNQKLDQQTYLAEASRRGALTAEFASLAERVGLERAQLVKAGKVLPWSRFGIDEAKHVQLDEGTSARLSAFTRSAKPYRYLELELDPTGNAAAAEATGLRGFFQRVLSYQGPSLNSRPLSPERGQTLSFLSSSLIDLSDAETWGLDFSNADLRGVMLAGTRARTLRLPRADLTGATLVAVDWGKADLRGASFQRACWQGGDLALAKLKGADLSGARLNDIELPIPENFANVILDKDTDLDGSYAQMRDWLQRAKQVIAREHAPFLDNYRVVEKSREFITYDFDGKPSKAARMVFILERTGTKPNRPQACDLLPGA